MTQVQINRLKLKDMQFAELRVLHLPKELPAEGASKVDDAVQSFKACQEVQGAFYVETCQRWIWVVGPNGLPLASELPSSAEVFQGQQAYLFLLRMACGLESKILGETDVFGQLKKAWNQAEQSCNSFTWELSPWMRKLFEDTKEIRSRYLQNVGGSSYGSLVRKMLREKTPSLDGPILLLGAGQLAHAVAPFLIGTDLWLWNRSEPSLRNLYNSLISRSKGQIRILNSQEEEQHGWVNASHVVVCVPFDSHKDSQRVEWFHQGRLENRSVVHLGGHREQSESWSSITNLSCLDDLFALQNSLGSLREALIAQAVRACKEKAYQRSQSTSCANEAEEIARFA